MESFSVGTGASLYARHLLPAMLSAEHEILLVTCYWAPSKTLAGLRRALEQLAAARRSSMSSSSSSSSSSPLRVRICLSSRSLLQKLLHTPSRRGHDYPPSTWEAQLGLPSPALLAAAGIDLRVRSLFFLPFGVVHPKFLVVDRRRAFVPSCNVSWEPWLEACLELARAPGRGVDGDGGRDPDPDPVDGLLDFYRRVWERDADADLSFPPAWWERAATAAAGPADPAVPVLRVRSPADTSVRLAGPGAPPAPVAVEWLPSPHHRNPRFRPLPWQTARAPDTPLNAALLRLLAGAARHVYVLTPNVTSPPFVAAAAAALARGVDVTVVTGRRMMAWEQLLTAGTTTGRCVRDLAGRHRRLLRSAARDRDRDRDDLEAGPGVGPGALRISYFRPAAAGREGGDDDDDDDEEEEPVQSHVKLTIVDGDKTVLGSGNMDRASWFTSQELGVLVRSAAFATAVKGAVDQALEGRLDPFYPPGV